MARAQLDGEIAIRERRPEMHLPLRVAPGGDRDQLQARVVQPGT